MGRSSETFNKKEKEKKRAQKKKEKQARKEERKANSAAGGSLDDMIAYVDENGNITDTPPDPEKMKKKVKASSIEIGVPKQVDDFDYDAERRGKVAFFNHNKGYGFIYQDGTQDKYFVHQNGVKQPIQEGDRVSFTLEKGQRGLNAINVKLI